MVFFNCDACGESLKKNQVEKHYQFKCRSCSVLSCVDCGKEFWGNSYQEHTKCISEEEKYSGKDYKAKPNANKGEKKQDAWIEQVQSAISKAHANPKLRGVLNNIQQYPNIPRKKAKFEKFLQNSMKIWDQRLIGQAWELISAEMGKAKVDQASKAEPEEKNEESVEKVAADSTTESGVNADGSTASNVADRKPSKREKKEERRKKMNKEEKKDKRKETDDCDVSEKVTKKSKKRKRQEIEENTVENGDIEEGKKKKQRKDCDTSGGGDDTGTSKKKKKHKNGNEESLHMNGDSVKEDAEACKENESETSTRVKFSWESTIIQCLESAADNELSVKRLRKKVLAEFWASGGDEKMHTEEKALSKFNKKISHNPKLKVHKEKVKLLQ